jgi:hypothetical protein
VDGDDLTEVEDAVHSESLSILRVTTGTRLGPSDGKGANSSRSFSTCSAGIARTVHLLAPGPGMFVGAGGVSRAEIARDDEVGLRVADDVLNKTLGLGSRRLAKSPGGTGNGWQISHSRAPGGRGWRPQSP